MHRIIYKGIKTCKVAVGVGIQLLTSAKKDAILVLHLHKICWQVSLIFSHKIMLELADSVITFY